MTHSLELVCNKYSIAACKAKNYKKVCNWKKICKLIYVSDILKPNSPYRKKIKEILQNLTGISWVVWLYINLFVYPFLLSHKFAIVHITTILDSIIKTIFKRASKLSTHLSSRKDQRKCKTNSEKYKQWLAMKTRLIKIDISYLFMYDHNGFFSRVLCLLWFQLLPKYYFWKHKVFFF